MELTAMQHCCNTHLRYCLAMSNYVSVQSRGTIAIPADIRKKFHLDEPGAQVEVISDGDRIILIPTLPVAATQAWYWTKDNLEGERQADIENASGQGETFDTDEDFLTSLTKV
jgi:antitoxin MazE